MMSSHTITLFTERADPGPRPATFVLSIIAHGLAVAVILFGIAYKPPVARISTERYVVRQLDLRGPEEVRRAAAAARVPSPGSSPGAPAAAAKAPPRLPVLRQMTQAPPGPQTLLQPDLLNPATVSQKIPVPQVLIWSPSKTPVKKIEPPLPEKPTSADVKPAVNPPNQETDLANVNIASSDKPSPHSPVTASTTSPVSVHVPEQVQLPPATASQATEPPTPAAILSLSDLRMKEGTAVLPPVNESAASNKPGVLAPGTQNPSLPENGAAPAAQPGANAAGQGSTTEANKSGPAGEAGKPNASASPTGTGPSSDASAAPTETQIALPKDGSFGAVVVGETLQEQFPEIAGVWSGRTAYTAYLHVGLAKSWILQYSLPLSADPSGGGTVARLEAPWPYNIVRPNLAPGSIDADALMIHGFVNQAGRFETLSVVFPQPFAASQFVLAALQQWQFRPAMQNGQSAKVEILLIIPEELD